MPENLSIVLTTYKTHASETNGIVVGQHSSEQAAQELDCFYKRNSKH